VFGDVGGDAVDGGEVDDEVVFDGEDGVGFEPSGGGRGALVRKRGGGGVMKDLRVVFGVDLGDAGFIAFFGDH
jgi:hypothetical protein